MVISVLMVVMLFMVLARWWVVLTKAVGRKVDLTGYGWSDDGMIIGHAGLLPGGGTGAYEGGFSEGDEDTVVTELLERYTTLFG